MQKLQKTAGKSSHTKRNRVSELQSNRATESQSVRDSEQQSDRVAENQRDRCNRGYRATDATDETDDSALAARVTTLQEAVSLSLKQEITEYTLFQFARAMKAFEVTTGTKCETGVAFAEWWRTAEGTKKLPPEAQFDEYAFLFEDAYERAKTPLGANVLDAAIKRAKTQLAPPQANGFSPNIAHLVSVCWQLQLLAGESPFFLSVRSAQQVLAIARPQTASAILTGLVRRGILEVESQGTPGGRRATRYRFQRTVDDCRKSFADLRAEAEAKRDVDTHETAPEEPPTVPLESNQLVTAVTEPTTDAVTDLPAITFATPTAADAEAHAADLLTPPRPELGVAWWEQHGQDKRWLTEDWKPEFTRYYFAQLPKQRRKVK